MRKGTKVLRTSHAKLPCGCISYSNRGSCRIADGSVICRCVRRWKLVWQELEIVKAK